MAHFFYFYSDPSISSFIDCILLGLFGPCRAAHVSGMVADKSLLASSTDDLSLRITPVPHKQEMSSVLLFY